MCACNMLMDGVVSADVYLLDLWAGTRQLWNGTFRPSNHGEWAWSVWGGAGVPTQLRSGRGGRLL